MLLIIHEKMLIFCIFLLDCSQSTVTAGEVVFWQKLVGWSQTEGRLSVFTVTSISPSAALQTILHSNEISRLSVVVWVLSCSECAVKLSECSWEASHGVCVGDGHASGVQSGPHLHNRWKPLLPAAQWISGELPVDVLAPQSRPRSYWPEQLSSLWFDLSFQQQVIQIKLHQIRRIYKRRHGLRPLVRSLSSSQLKNGTSP